MFFSKSFIGKLYLLSICWDAATAVPVVEPNGRIDTHENATVNTKRAPGDSYNEPVDAVFNTDGWESSAEEDCYIMLCVKGGERVYQRVENPNAVRPNRRGSGATFRPFRDDQLDRRHTRRITNDAISAEEFPWASTQQGGSNAVLMGTTDDEQRAQGGRVGNGYDSSRVGYGKWFRITFVQTLPFGVYCNALFNSNPPDTSVCPNTKSKRKGKKTKLLGQQVDPSDYAFQIDRTGKTPYGFVQPNYGYSYRSVETEEADA